MSQARQAILPFFIPMQGCNYRCVYCDQHSISGQEQPPAPAEIAAAAWSYAGKRPVELAFYGGSFSALPWSQQQAYLEAAQPALRHAKIDAIRISTRPDALSAEAVARLAAYGVATVELGIQSFDAQALQACGRAYDPDTARAACRLVRQAGLKLGIQLMTGLPEDSRLKSLRSMRQSCSLAPDFLRVYPTLVLAGTPLARLYDQGLYQPQGLRQAALLAADMLALARAADIPLIRLGLNPSPSLEASLLAGPYHPAFGQLARGALKLKQALMLLTQAGKRPQLLRCPANERPLLSGQKNEQLVDLQKKYPGLSLEQAADLAPGTLQTQSAQGEILTLTEAAFLRHYTAQLNEEMLT